MRHNDFYFYCTFNFRLKRYWQVAVSVIEVQKSVTVDSLGSGRYYEMENILTDVIISLTQFSLTQVLIVV